MKRFISIFLAITMLTAILPMNIFANETNDEKISITASTENAIDVLGESSATEIPDLDTGLFTSSYYRLYVERDYEQHRPIELKNNTSSDKEIYLVCGETPVDLAIDFIKGGSKSEPILLKAGETKEVELAIFAQNATQEYNEFNIYAYEVGKDGDTASSKAEVRLNVNIPTLNISTTLVSSDNNTLAKTYKITNRDDNIVADLTVFVDKNLSDFAYFDTYIENYSLGIGESVEFTVKPDLKKMKENNLLKIEGNIIISGQGQSENVELLFDTNGQEIQYISMAELEEQQDDSEYKNLHIDKESSSVKYFDGSGWKEVTEETSLDSLISSNGEFNWKFENSLKYGDDEINQIKNTVTIKARPYVGSANDFVSDIATEINQDSVLTSTEVLMTGAELNQLIEETQPVSQISLMSSEKKFFDDDEAIVLSIDVLAEGHGVADEFSPYTKVYNYGKKALVDYPEKFKNSDKVYNNPNLDKRYKFAYGCFDTAYWIMESVDTFADFALPFPLSTLYTIAVQPIHNKIDEMHKTIEDIANQKYNYGYKWSYYYSGHQCTNRGLISSDFYVPNYIKPKEEPKPEEPLYPQLESATVDVPSGTVEPGTVVTITPPEKGKVYVSFDGGEFVEYTEPLVIEDSVSVRTRTSDDSEPPVYSDSEIEEYNYSIEGQPFAPKSEPVSGVVENGDTITLTAEEGEKIFFAIDDNLEDEEFTEEYTEYTEPIEITKDCKIRTYVTKEGAENSRTAELSYEVAIEPPVLLSTTARNISLLNEEAADETNNQVRLFYTGRMFGAGYVNSTETNYKYLLNGKEVGTGTNTGLTEVNIAEIPTDGLKLGKVNNFVRDYDTNPGNHSVSTDNRFTLIYPSDSVVCFVGDISNFPDVKLRPDFAIYNENIYSGDDLIIGQENKIRVNFYNLGSQSGFYTINLYVNDNIVDTKENQFMEYFSSDSIEFDFTPTEADNDVKVEIVNTTVDLAEETSDNNIAEKSFTAREPEVPSIDSISPSADTEQSEQIAISATISKNRDVKSVVFSVDDTEITSEVKNSGTNYWVSVDTLEIGAHKATVKVTDMTGNEYTKEQEFNIIAPIERYENYDFYYMQSQIYVKPNVEFDLNELVGVCDDEWKNFEELKDYEDNITVEFDSESGLTQKENEKFIFTATETGRFYITLKLGVNETDVSIYVSELDMQSCTYNFKYEDAMYPNVDIYHKDEYGWSYTWDYEETYGENGKSSQISIYPDNFTSAEDYKIFIKDNNRFMVEDFINGSVDVTGNDSATLSIKSNKDISDVSCTVYYLFDEDNRINAGYISENDEGKLNNLSLEKGKYQLRLSFSYGDDYYSGIQKEIDLTTETSAEIDLLSLLNYAVVDLTAISPSEDVEIYAVDEYGTTFINQVKISDNSYNVVLDDDMVENTASYKLFIVDGNKFYFAPLSTDTMVVELPETNNLEFLKADNITINDVKINSIDNIDYSVQLSYEDNTPISLPKNKYNIGVQFKVDDVDVYQEYDVDLSENNATVDLNQAASEINFVISWSELYDDDGYLNLYSNGSRISTNYKNNSGTTLDVGNYSWTLNLSRGNARYSISNNSEIVADNQTKINVGTTFVGTLEAQEAENGYKANQQIAFRLNDVKDEFGNELNSCNSRKLLNAKVIYTNIYDESDVYEIPLEINSINTGSSLYTPLPSKAGKYNATLVIEGERVNAPTASKESGTYKNRVSVELASDNEEATIYYTTDGSEPTNESTKYTGAITINTSCVLKAIAIVGSDASPVATYEYTITKSSSSGGGVRRYTITISYVDENGSEVATSKVSNRYGTIIAEKDLTLPDGYIITEDDFSHKIVKNEKITVKVENTNTSAPDDKWENPFEDVNITDWFYDSVKYVYENTLMNGVSESEFAPDTTLTRAMLVTVLYRNEGEPATNKSIPFADVDMGAYYGDAVSWAKQNGIVNGVSETEFAPNDNITREQIAAIMHRYAQYKGYDVSIGEKTNILSYNDYDSISEYAVASMQYAVGSGLMKGKSTSTLNPLDNATRAEIATILQRFIENKK